MSLLAGSLHRVTLLRAALGVCGAGRALGQAGAAARDRISAATTGAVAPVVTGAIVSVTAPVVRWSRRESALPIVALVECALVEVVTIRQAGDIALGLEATADLTPSVDSTRSLVGLVEVAALAGAGIAEIVSAGLPVIAVSIDRAGQIQSIPLPVSPYPGADRRPGPQVIVPFDEVATALGEQEILVIR